MHRAPEVEYLRVASLDFGVLDDTDFVDSSVLTS